MAPKKISRLFRLAASITLFVFTLSALWQAPAQAFFFGGVSLKDEKEMGHKFDVMIRSNLPIVQDPEVSEYVRYLVERIASSIPPQPFNFHSAVILHNAMNAFAVPGGYVYVFTGLLMNFTSEDQVAGDGPDTLGQTMIMKHTARKIRRVGDGNILAGFAGTTADAFTLFELFEAKLKEYHGNLTRAAVELTKQWRRDKYLQKLEAMLLLADREHILLLSGTGDVIEPDDNVAAIGSGGPYALAAARALLRHSDLDAETIARDSMQIASEICVYTNDHFTVETL